MFSLFHNNYSFFSCSNCYRLLFLFLLPVLLMNKDVYIITDKGVKNKTQFRCGLVFAVDSALVRDNVVSNDVRLRQDYDNTWTIFFYFLSKMSHHDGSCQKLRNYV